MKKIGKTSTPHDLNSPVKYLFGLYQCLHHLSILTGGTSNGKKPLFSQKVEELDRFFVPAMSAWNSLFRKNCHDINENWRKKQIANLVEHYEYCVEALKGSISASHLTISDRLKLLNQARGWAKQTYRRKFKAHIFDKVDQMIQKLYEPKKTLEMRGNSKTSGKGPLTGTSSGSVSQRKADMTSTQTLPPAKVSVPGPSGGKTTRAKVAAAGVASTPTKRKRSLSSSEPSPSRSSPTLPQSQKRSKSSASYADKVKSPPPPQKCTKTNLAKPIIKRFPKLQKKQRGQGMHDVWQIPKVVKEILILGDSNLGRASKIERVDAQVVSYSGINLLKMVRLFENFKFGKNSNNPGRSPKHVVLSVGLNDKGCKPFTNEVSLNRLLSRVKQEFPGSKISLYQQPFDRRLDKNEIATLEALNDAFRTKCEAQGHNCIPALPKSQFKVIDNDKIHWTEECANMTIQHIFDNLN